MRPVVVFPKTHIKELYYQIHIQYMINWFLSAGYDVKVTGQTSTSTTSFLITLNGKALEVDFSDFQAVTATTEYPCLKFHCSKELLEKNKKITSFPPVSFYNWSEYNKLAPEINYTCNSDLVLNMQRPYGGAVERRNFVRSILKSRYNVESRHNLPQVEYWKKINNCLVSVFVPGARNDMIDRGHLQYMAFGCCTVSPFITDILPNGTKLIPDEHYVVCKDDYSDLIEKIEWCKLNREKCRMIGSSAKEMFLSCCYPRISQYE